MGHQAWLVQRWLAVCQHDILVSEVSVDNLAADALATPLGREDSALPGEQLLGNCLALLQGQEASESFSFLPLEQFSDKGIKPS